MRARFTRNRNRRWFRDVSHNRMWHTVCKCTFGNHAVNWALPFHLEDIIDYAGPVGEESIG
jgi:hypothetical protein